MNYILIPLTLFFIFSEVSCTTTPVIKNDELPPQTLLFPDGLYKQEVAVNVSAANPPQNFDFDCFIQKNPDEMLFVGYNNFGFSIFKIREKKGQPIIAESSVEQINQHKDFFINIFKLVKNIFSLQRNNPSLHAYKPNISETNDDSNSGTRKMNIPKQAIHETILETSIQDNEIKAHVLFSELNEFGVPQQITVDTKNQYKVSIKTNSFEQR